MVKTYKKIDKQSGDRAITSVEAAELAIRLSKEEATNWEGGSPHSPANAPDCANAQPSDPLQPPAGKKYRARKRR